MNWAKVFERWMRERPPIDRIDYVDVPRFVGQRGMFDMDGPVNSLRRNYDQAV